MSAADPLQSLRDVEVPTGARQRVRARIEAQLDRAAVVSYGARRLALAAVGSFAVALIAFVVLTHSRPRAISVAAGQRVDVVVGTGHVALNGPAEVEMTGDRLALVRGSLEARGDVRVAGPSCEVVVHGTAELAVRGPQLTVRVFAGSVEIVKPDVTCDVIELTPPQTQLPATPANAESAEHLPNAAFAPARTTTPGDETVMPSRTTSASHDAASRPGATSHERSATVPRDVAPPSASDIEPTTAPNAVATTASHGTESIAPDAPRTEARNAEMISASGLPAEPKPPSPAASGDRLSESVAAYRAAALLEATDLGAAREAWLAWRVRWAESPLAQGADLHVLGVLDRLGQRREAAELARNFLRRYPESPRRADVQRIIEGKR